jgi:hypothetical protein
MNSFSLIKRLFLVLTVVFFASCDDEFSELGADVVDGDIHSNLIRTEAVIKAYDRATGPVQTNNLDINTLGVYNNPVFGKTTAHYVTQVEMTTSYVNPTLYNPVIDSVWIYIPYRNTMITAASAGVDATYKVDSIYSGENDSFTLDIKRNNFFLRDSDANSGGTEGQKYYSDYKSIIDGQAGSVSLLKGGPQNHIYKKTVIKRSARYTTAAGVLRDTIVETIAPGMFYYLKEDIIGQVLFGSGSAGKLLNNSVFREYFRGLYFTATQNGDQSAYGAPNFDGGIITVKYTDHLSATDNAPTKKTMQLSLTGNSLNLFENNYSNDFLNAVNTSNAEVAAGESRLYIKGGEGSMAFIDIDTTSLADLKPDAAGNKRALINEANLIFYVDESANAMGKVVNGKKAIEPPRIFLYDVNNKRPMYDYYTDGTTISSYPKLSKYVHGGIKDITTGSTQYKIRITDHINNIINKDSTNVKIGLVVTEGISLITNATLKNPWTEPWFKGVPPVLVQLPVTILPAASVTHPFGTVLYGTNLPTTDPKRLKLEIFYTKPE